MTLYYMGGDTAQRRVRMKKKKAKKLDRQDKLQSCLDALVAFDVLMREDGYSTLKDERSKDMATALRFSLEPWERLFKTIASDLK